MVTVAGVGDGEGAGVEVGSARCGAEDAVEEIKTSQCVYLLEDGSYVFVCRWIHDKSSWATKGKGQEVGVFQGGKYDDEPSLRFKKIERQTLRHSCGAAGDGVLPG